MSIKRSSKRYKKKLQTDNELQNFLTKSKSRLITQARKNKIKVTFVVGQRNLERLKNR